MTHSHDTATPALSVESEEATLRAVHGYSIMNDCWFVKLYPFTDKTAAVEATSAALAMIAAAPAPNSSPAAKDGEADCPFSGPVHDAEMCPFCHPNAFTPKAAALATPSPQPADAVREALLNARKALLSEHWHEKSQLISQIDAALASDPAPAGEAVETARLRGFAK